MRSSGSTTSSEVECSVMPRGICGAMSWVRFFASLRMTNSDECGAVKTQVSEARTGAPRFVAMLKQDMEDADVNRDS